jgi:polyisoprenoid-binding protein YceI
VTVPVRSIAIAVALLAACGGAAAPEPTIAQSTATATTTPAATVSSAGPWTFTVDSSSKATVRVREVLAQIRAPGDAVLSTSAVTGSFTLNADGTFAPTSKITVDLTTLRSDQSQRDQYIKDSTLQTRRFPTAEFVPTKATGAPLPLPANADMKFTLFGDITIHGVTKSVTFAITAARVGSKLTVTATAEPAWKFADFGMTVPRVASVLSIEDDIRLEVALVATETG